MHAGPAPSLEGTTWLLGSRAGQAGEDRLRDRQPDRDGPHEPHGDDAGEAGEGVEDPHFRVLPCPTSPTEEMTMPKAGDPTNPVEKLRGVFWLDHDRGGQTHPDTKHLGDWWIVWKCRHGHRHREKVGPRALAKDQYQRRRTQARVENFCLRTEQRATPVLFTDLAARWMKDHARVM